MPIKIFNRNKKSSLLSLILFPFITDTINSINPSFWGGGLVYGAVMGIQDYVVECSEVRRPGPSGFIRPGRCHVEFSAPFLLLLCVLHLICKIKLSPHYVWFLDAMAEWLVCRTLNRLVRVRSRWSRIEFFSFFLEVNEQFQAGDRFELLHFSPSKWQKQLINIFCEEISDHIVIA